MNRKRNKLNQCIMTDLMRGNNLTTMCSFYRLIESEPIFYRNKVECSDLLIMAGRSLSWNRFHWFTSSELSIWTSCVDITKRRRSRPTIKETGRLITRDSDSQLTNMDSSMDSIHLSLDSLRYQVFC
jgi:hypothetical protein